MLRVCHTIRKIPTDLTDAAVGRVTDLVERFICKGGVSECGEMSCIREVLVSVQSMNSIPYSR